MPQPVNKTFRVTVPITKCYLRKSADGAEKYVIEGMASNTHLDLSGERMATSAIDAMSKSLDTHPVYLNNEHDPAWDSDFGEITSLWKTDEYQLMMEAELDPDHYRTKTLVKAMEKGKQLGLSIEGWVQESALELDESIGKMVKTYKDILLSKISITGTPAVADTWFAPITKSVNWSDTPMPKPQVEKTDEEQEAPASQTPVEETEVVEDVAEETTDEPTATAETEKVEAPEPESTEKSTEEEESVSDEPAGESEPEQDEPAPVEQDAAAQEETDAEADEPAEKSAPEQAATDTSEVAKAALLGDWTEADITWEAIEAVASNLQWFVFDVMIDKDKEPAEKQRLIAEALAEFTTLLTGVTDSLITSGVSEDTAKAVEVARSETKDSLKKSLSSVEANREELQKSLDLATEEVTQLKEELTKTSGELKDAQDVLEKTKARKAFVVGKFGELETIEEASKRTSESVYDRWMKHELGVPSERSAT